MADASEVSRFLTRYPPGRQDLNADGSADKDALYYVRRPWIMLLTGTPFMLDMHTFTIFSVYFWMYADSVNFCWFTTRQGLWFKFQDTLLGIHGCNGKRFRIQKVGMRELIIPHMVDRPCGRVHGDETVLES